MVVSMLRTQRRWCCSIRWSHWHELVCIEVRRLVGVDRLKYCVRISVCNIVLEYPSVIQFVNYLHVASDWLWIGVWGIVYTAGISASVVEAVTALYFTLFENTNCPYQISDTLTHVFRRLYMRQIMCVNALLRLHIFIKVFTFCCSCWFVLSHSSNT